MKPVRRIDSTSQSCSCTSCLYKSESEQPSIRNYVAHGSRIDRLYFGKYIPLRERKLLNRLVRTRAVYDDLRARLISDSTLSLETKADLRPGKHRRIIKPLDSEKSGAILELVDIIDKGAALGPKKLSDCCSCCSCSSKSKMLERHKKEHRGKRVYGQNNEEEFSETGQTGTGEGGYARAYEKKYGKTGQTGTGEGVYATYERQFGKTIPGKTGERYNKRGVRFKAKHIRSEPCTCTFKFSGLIKKHSKAMFKKVRPPPLEEPFLDAEEQYIAENSKKKKIARKSFQKFQDLRSKLEKDMKKLTEAKANIKQNLQLHAKKSLEQVKQVKNKIKNDIESGVRKSLQVVKGLYPKETFEPVEYPEVETTFKIKKDSLVKFKDYLKRKEVMKYWECDLKCEPDECVPEECFKIIKLRRLHKRNRQRDRKHGPRYEMNREVKIGGTPLSRSDSSVQAEQISATTATHIKKQKPVLRVDGKKQVIEKRLEFESKRVKKGGGNKNVKKSDKSFVLPATYKERVPRTTKKKDEIGNKNKTLNEKGIIIKQPHSRGRQAVRISSSFSFGVEFSKNRPNEKLFRLSQPSGIHVHAPRRKHKKLHRHHGSDVISKSSLESSQGTSENLKTRLIQTDKYTVATITSQGQIVSRVSQCECEKRRGSNVKTSTNYGAKTVSSITNNVATIDKNISKEVKQKGRLSQVSLLPSSRVDILTPRLNEIYTHHKQAVRIGSTFSFDIEFYKKDGEDISKAPKSINPQKISKPIKEKVLHTRSKHGQVRRRLVQVKGTSTKAYNQAKTTINRCFCTLKLNKGIKNKAKQKVPVPAMIDKYVETKKPNLKLYDLLPYECEPGICVPDECDPILCKKMLDLRKQRNRRRISKSTGSHTESRKTKSTSSIMSKPLTSAKAKIVQSSTVPTKIGSTSAPRRYKNNLNLGRKDIIKTNINASERQAVRIGSSFSFNIEFYKDTQDPALAIKNKSSFSSMPAKIYYKEEKIQEKKKKEKPGKHDKHNKSIFKQVKKVNKYIGPPLKNCLCTINLFKTKAPKKKTVEKTTKLTAHTQTFGEAPIGESVNKGTRTKRKRQYKLLPYECEPYVCVPGECDPYICLENIKRRELNTRNISVFTDKPDMHSMSSLTESSLRKSEAILVHPKLFRKDTNMKAKYFKGLDGRPKPTEETYNKTSKSKQAVRIGSSFKFSIEFSKQMPGPVTLTKYPKIKQSLNVNPKMNRDKGITVTKVRVNHGDTQAQESRKVNKALLVRPMLKRCFCTLNLQKKTKHQHRKDKQQTNYFGPNVYTVGRAMTTKTEIISHSHNSQKKTKLLLTEPKTKVISVSTSSFLLNKYVKSLNSKYEMVNLYSTFKIPIQLKKPVVTKSNLSMKLDILRQVLPFKQSWVRYIRQPLETFSHAYIEETAHEYLKLFDQPSYQSLKKNTDITKYLERCFCTMNVKISHPGQNPGIKKISHKLKPYECEPGVCIPDECDPYECNKLIMRRKLKNVHTSSDAKSISSHATSNAGVVSKSTHMKTRFQKHSQVMVPQQYKPPGQRETKHRQAVRLKSTSNNNQQYKPMGHHDNKHRQAVRLKSSFSFDLEFYKHRFQPSEKYFNKVETITYKKKPENQKTNKSVNKGIQEKKKNVKATKLQSTALSVHKGTASKTKRCFCTLKLQKKGRIYRENIKLNSILPAKQLPIITSRNVKIGTTKKYENVPVDLNDLKLYECEPGICVPGQCDPYKCLELIKHRRNLGVNTIQRENNSVPSMTTEDNYKTRAVNAVPVTTQHKSTKPIKYVENIQNNNDISQISSRSTRPAVRIGSSFSFNMEFFRDVPQESQYKEINVQNTNLLKSDSKQIKDKNAFKDDFQHKKNKKNKQAITSPRTNKISHRGTKMNKTNDETAITTSLLKRCFCTAKLLTTKGPANRNKKTAIKILRSKQNKVNQPVEKNDLHIKRHKNSNSSDKVVKTAEKVTNTNLKHKVFSPRLEPYECEPGICIPGQCDPYLCAKIIQQRLTKRHSKKSETEEIRTYSTSSNFGNYKRSKNERTQAQNQLNKKQIQHVSKDVAHKNKRTLNKRFAHIENMSKDMPSSNTKTINADQRVVRIGSNFSFNIEFYKENVDNSVIKEKVKEVKTDVNKDAKDEKISKGNILRHIGTDTMKEDQNKSKVKTKNKTSGVSPLLKRCFCTLKLMKKPIKQTKEPKKTNQLDTKSIITKTVETQSRKRLKGQTLLYDSGQNLSPYECEPFVCIPGECDPVECLKRINKRQKETKEFGTVTKHPKRKSIGNVANKMKNEHLQVKQLTMKPNKSVQKTNYVEITGPEKSYNQHRQAVRIGSNFSFNIEFYKDVGVDLPNVVMNRPLEELNFQKDLKKVNRHNAKIQSSYFKHNMDSQVASTKLQTTETAMPHLKRCFCTLPLRNKKLTKNENKSIKGQSNQPKSDHSSVGNFLKKCICNLKLNKIGKQQNKAPAPAVKYEIKGTSTQIRRAPQNHVKKPIRLLEPYECEPFICIPGECDPYECLKRIQQRQVRDFGTDYKKNVKDSATDSIKKPITKSTKAQYHQKRKYNTRGTTSLVSRRTRRSNDIAQFQYDPSLNANRQVVRIGSNFSFNIEFFKDHVTATSEQKYLKADKPPNMIKQALQTNRPERPPTKCRGSINAIKHQRDKKSQCSYPKRHVPCPSANIAPKRCFCTLKLLQKANQPQPEGKLVLPKIPTKDKATVTKVKYAVPQELGLYECPPLMCIPGECNPYDCLEKIRKRQLIQKSRNVGTRTGRTSIASVGNRAVNIRTHKVQSPVPKRKNVIASTPHSEPQSEIIKSSRKIENLRRRNKSAVRIGSNFNFNVEFFKHKLQPAVAPVSNIINARYNEEDSKPYLNKNVTVGARKVGLSNTNKINLKDHGSEPVNSLKRCFCTLQLQKPNNKRNGRIKLHRPGNNVRYPQAFTVGRVSVFHNNVTKISQTKKVDRTRSTSTDHKLLNKTVGTKSNRKYIDFPSYQCDPNSCPDYKKRILGKRIENDMQTILPFAPSKFNKESKTYVSNKNKLKNNKPPRLLRREGVHKPSDTSIVGKGGRRLTAKKSKKSIPTNSVIETKSSCKDSFFCRCVRFFSRKSETRSEGFDKPENMNIDKHINKSKTIPARIKLTIPPKRAKSFNDNCPYICPKDTEEMGKRYSVLQSGDVSHSIMKAFKTSKMDPNKSKIQGGEKFVTFADNTKYSNDIVRRRKTIKSMHSKSSPRSRLCYSCSANDCPLNKDDQQTSDELKAREKSIKSSKKAPSYSESADDCQYCACCKIKIDTDEISKGAGDRRLTISSQYEKDADICPCGKESVKREEETISRSKKITADNLSQKYSIKKGKCCSRIKPLLEIRLDPHSHNIINKGEVKNSIERFQQQQHNKSHQNEFCICCKCLKKREIPKDVTTKKPQTSDGNGKPPVKGTRDVKKKFENLFLSKTNFLTNRLKPPKKPAGPCVCGSKICAIESKKKLSGKHKEKAKLLKTCVCGSDICTVESRKMKLKKEKILNKAKRKRKSIADEKERKEINRRIKIQEKKDEIRRLKRINRNKVLESRVKGYKDSSDVMLAIDSLVDIGRLGVNTFTDTLRYTAKTVTDPKVTCEMLCRKCRKKDPETLLQQLQQDYLESNVGSTARRLKMRCSYMKKVQSLRETLEGNRFTHFILHMADKNAKTRKFKPRPVRHIREPLDFQCSLYMATLRKRPYLSVYYKWPWFYPHFMSMLNIWRQFTDIMLFLLAAVVWSPCILCMEACRAVMCCFFCTG